MIRKVFLEDLPKWKEGMYKGKTNWSKLTNYKVKFVYDDIEGEIEILDYNVKTRYLHIKYLNGDPFKIKAANFMQGMFGKLLDRITNEFKIQVHTKIIDEKRNLIIIDKENRYKTRKDGNPETQKWYKYKCNECNYEGWIIESSLLNNNGCSCCDNKTAVVGINSIVDTDPWMTPYFQGGYDEAKLYTKGSSKKVIPICPDCGRVKGKEFPISAIHNHNISCICKDGISFPNKVMFNMLEQLKANFESEKRFDWCKYTIKGKNKIGVYDFYFELGNIEYIVEMDGEFHSINNRINGQSAIESKTIDDLKDLRAKEKGIEVIRIDCVKSEMDLIRNNILSSKLSHIFDLSKIDWLKCEEFALSNLVKIACDYKNNDHNLSTTEIGEMMKLHCTTIMRYLKKGTKLGWCNYSVEESISKRRSKAGNASRLINSKKVEIFKDNVSLGIFNSRAELERQSEKLFGVKLGNSQISKACDDTGRKYKGYTFKTVI